MSVNMPENASVTGQVGHRFEVRNTGGTLYGTLLVHNISDLSTGEIRFAQAHNTRFHGLGFLELEHREQDRSFEVARFKVSEWATRPTIGKHGSYMPGRIDFVLIWDGPIDALRAVHGFQRSL